MVQFSPPPKRSGFVWWAPLAIVLVVVALTWFIQRPQSPPPAPTRSSAGVSTSATTGGAASATNTPTSGLSTIDESALPVQARTTLELIRAGGPFPHRQDDATFSNREGILPKQARGYYREYTVRTPGSSDRGPRRIVAGRDHDLYWTTDHYASFRQILEGR